MTTIKPKRLLIYLVVFSLFAAFSDAINAKGRCCRPVAAHYGPKLCKVGHMPCKTYCLGALKVKLYQLIDQGAKPLCEIRIKSHKKNLGCVVSIDGAKQYFGQDDLILIAKTNNRYRFNAILNKRFLLATYRCPIPRGKAYKGAII